MDDKYILKKCKWIYDSQRGRCQNKNNTAYKNYGAKGIKVEYSLKEFREWYLKHHKPGFVVGRVDHENGYYLNNLIAEPSMRFSTIERNSRHPNPCVYRMKKILVKHNKRNVPVAIFSTIKDASETMNISDGTILRHCKKRSNEVRCKWRFEYYKVVL